MKYVKHAASLAIAAALVSTTASASYFTVEHGITCQAAYGSQSIVGVGEPGMGNYSSTQTARLFCAAPRYFSDVTEIEVEVTDSSTSQNLSCYGFAQNMWTGSNTWSNTRYSCSQYGGCPDPTTSWTGRGMLDLKFPSPQYNLAGISCSLPPAAPYASWVANAEYLSNSQSY